MRVTVFVEKNKNNYYQISCEQEICDCYLGGYGYSVQEAKADLMECLNEIREISISEGKKFPKDIEIVYKYDIPSFFNVFDFINISKFAAKAGINESKMRQYKTGSSFASESTTKKIMETINQIGIELTAVRL